MKEQLSYKTVLTNLRKATGLSSKQFGSLIGFDIKPTCDPFRKIEKGEQALTIEQAYMLTKQFDLTIGQLMGHEPISYEEIACKA